MSSRLQMSRERQNRGLQIHLCCTVFRRDIELGQLHSRLASVENFTSFIYNVVPEIGAKMVLADTLSDLLSLSLEGHPCGESCPVQHGWKTLEASVQLFHIRPVHCLKCFVTSSTTDFIRTEQELQHYNNIFVRNGSRGYLQVRAKVHFQFYHERLAHPQG